MNKRVLSASKGMILTNGKIYCKTIYLGKYSNPEDFYEISEDAYYTLIQTNDEEELVEE